MKKLKKNYKAVLGWIGVSISLIISSLWAFWGIIENFHEGWYYETVWENIFVLFIQYLLFTIVFSTLSIISIYWKKIGAGFFVVIAIFALLRFGGAHFSVIGVMILIPLFSLAALYYFGEIKKKKLALMLIIGIPLLIILVLGIPNFIKVSGRIDDGDYSARLVEGNGVSLIWAPEGPGWPESGESWDESKEICSMLNEEGTEVTDTINNIWRLPTTDECARSLTRHNENAGGVWDEESKNADYVIKPDKETPLWKVNSMVIYMWTADDVDDEDAYIIVYDGDVYTRDKQFGGYIGYRCVKEPE